MQWTGKTDLFPCLFYLNIKFTVCFEYTIFNFIFKHLPYFICRRDNKRRILKKNPLKNQRVMNRLNPYYKVTKKAALEIETRRKKAKAGIVDEKRGVS